MRTNFLPNSPRPKCSSSSSHRMCQSHSSLPFERLGPSERAAFLLHDVFDYDYAEVAKILDKPELARRQMIHRARARVRQPRLRFAVSAESRERVLGKFLTAAVTGDRNRVMALLAEDAECLPG